MEYDVIIIGGGPAGLTAAIYASRRNLKTLVISADVGGQITKTNEIENYPGFETISGVNLTQNFFKQAKSFGANFDFSCTKKISKVKDLFEVSTSSKDYKTKTIILAFGKKPRELNVPGEEELKGRGVSYCATCDAPFYKDKIVVVAGGGNSALDAAIVTSKVAKKVYLVHRRDSFNAEAVRIEKVKKLENVDLILNDEIKEIIGKDKVQEIVLKSQKRLQADGILIEVGFIIDRKLVENLVETDQLHQIITNEIQETSVSGIFAAGDLTQTPYKQVVIAAGEGAKAALSAFDYIQRKEGKRGIKADWH